MIVTLHNEINVLKRMIDKFCKKELDEKEWTYLIYLFSWCGIRRNYKFEYISPQGVTCHQCVIDMHVAKNKPPEQKVRPNKRSNGLLYNILTTVASQGKKTWGENLFILANVLYIHKAYGSNIHQIKSLLFQTIGVKLDDEDIKRALICINKLKGLRKKKDE